MAAKCKGVLPVEAAAESCMTAVRLSTINNEVAFHLIRIQIY